MTAARRHPNVVHREEAESTTVERGRHRFRRTRLAEAAGNRQLGASLYELAPGAVSYPFHYHCANEEAIFIVSGTGVARIGDQRVPVRAGDWIAHPVGPTHAHQMINDGAAPLVYLAVATDHKVEVVGYPDSAKVLAIGGERWDEPWHRRITRAESLDYWDGEPEA